MNINLFPAILLAGPPHSGKSVLAYLVTNRLRQMNIAHYLLRAVPDGEGNWFLQGGGEAVRLLRLKHKGQYTPAFLAHMHQVIENRALPLLVDIGGRPQPDQMDLLAACTHSVLLYRTAADLAEWQPRLAALHLLPVAELRSSQSEADQIEAHQPTLKAVITGLERDLEKRQSGLVIDALLEHLAGICRYDAEYLESVHLTRAPHPVTTERQLAARVGLPADQRGAAIWTPDALAVAAGWIEPGQPLALYGRGPVWLAAMLAARALPAPASIYDVRYGWMPIPPVLPGTGDIFQARYTALPGGAGWLECMLTTDALEAEDLLLNLAIDPALGLVLSGKLPRWAFAALARHFAPRCPWVAVDDPAHNRLVVVHSQTPSVPLGAALDRLAPDPLSVSS